MIFLRKVIIISLLIASSSSMGSEKDLYLWLDADFSNHFESSESIKIGAEAAIADFGGEIQGRKIKILEKNHQGNSKRSKKNIKDFLKDDRSIAMMSGIHSPPLLENQVFINKNQVPFLVPWAAAGPITRPEAGNNYIFRLSIDDSKAGIFLSEYAANTLDIKQPCLLLENTGWGRSNAKSMTAGFAKNHIKVKRIFWFQWGIDEKKANELSAASYKAQCDIVLLVANANEGSTLVKSIALYPHQDIIPIISHWGITGANFHKIVDHEIRTKTNLKFIQTKFNFNQINKNLRAERVLKTIRKLYPKIKNANDIQAGNGLSHAYDLTYITLLSLNEIDLNQNVEHIRKSLKEKLENNTINFSGLIKNYKRPFTPYSKENPDAHEALGKENFTLGYYTKNGTIYNIVDTASK